MKIETEVLETHEVKAMVEVEPERLEQAKNRAARQMAKSTKIPGFRPGKAPYGVILRHFGEANILERAMEMLVEDIYPEMIEELEIDPHGPGTLKNVPSMDPPKFEFVIPLKSTVELGDYQSVTVDYEPPDVTDDDIDKAIDRYREQQAVIETVDRPADMGDLVRLSLKGTLLGSEGSEDAVENDEENENGDAAPEMFQERSFTLEIVDEDDLEDWPFVGFTKQLIGKAAGDQGSLEHTFGDDDPNEHLQNKKYQFDYSIEYVQSKTLPELDDEFAISVSNFETLDEFRADIREALEQNAENQYDDEYSTKILDEIIEDSTIKYPPQMLEQETRDIRRDLENRLQQQGMNFDMYLQIRGMTEEEVTEEIRPVAERKIQETLVLLEIAQKEGIEVDSDQIEQQANWTMEYLTSNLTPSEARKIDKNDVLPNIYSNIMLDSLTRNAIDWLRRRSKGELEEEASEESEEDTVEGSVGSKSTEAEIEEQPSTEETEEEIVSDETSITEDEIEEVEK